MVEHLIDKDDLVDRITELAEINREWKPEFAEFCDEMVCMIEDTPFWSRTDLEPEPVKHGRWEFLRQKFHDGGYWDVYGCSECIHEEEVPIGGWLPNYCPNCGADMRGEVASEVMMQPMEG